MSTTEVAPLKPPADWFSMPEANGPTPLTYTPEGQVYGHIAVWNSCHTGFMNGAYSECVKPPKSYTDYSFFHVGLLDTDQGEMPVGRLIYQGTHASLSSSLQAASRHYDETGAVGAFVRARDGKHGIWVSGAVRSDLSPEGLRDLKANPPSGDWRQFNHGLELIASLAVPVPGFPVVRPQVALSASADGEAEVQALILPGYCDCEEPETLVASARTKGYMRRKNTLLSSMTAAVLTAKKRNSLGKSAFAIPSERRYPIHDRSHARNALARSSGKPEEGTVRRAVCRRYPDMCKK